MNAGTFGITVVPFVIGSLLQVLSVAFLRSRKTYFGITVYTYAAVLFSMVINPITVFVSGVFALVMYAAVCYLPDLSGRRA
jgi:hypothetical protein